VSEERVVPLEEFESRYMRAIYEKLGGNISRTADALGVTRNTLKKKLC
jgi:DNA-binding protein Fis